MSKHTVTHACGHTVTHRLYGPGKERDRKLARLAGECCQACADQHLVDRAHALYPDLPALQGSDKQVAWADRIRAQKIVRELAELDNWVAARGQAADVPADQVARAQRIVRDTIHRASAAAWIDARDTLYGQAWLLERFAAEGVQ